MKLRGKYLMPVELSWLVEDKVTYSKFIGKVTMDELHMISDFGIELMEQSPNPIIHSIQDLSELQSIPMNIKDMISQARVAKPLPKVGWQIAYHIPNKPIEILGKLLNKILNMKYLIATDYAEALEVLQSLDTNLDDLSYLMPEPTTEILFHADSRVEKLPNLKKTG